MFRTSLLALAVLLASTASAGEPQSRPDPTRHNPGPREPGAEAPRPVFFGEDEPQERLELKDPVTEVTFVESLLSNSGFWGAVSYLRSEPLYRRFIGNFCLMDPTTAQARNITHRLLDTVSTRSGIAGAVATRMAACLVEFVTPHFDPVVYTCVVYVRTEGNVGLDLHALWEELSDRRPAQASDVALASKPDSETIVPPAEASSDEGRRASQDSSPSDNVTPEFTEQDDLLSPVARDIERSLGLNREGEDSKVAKQGRREPHKHTKLSRVSRGRFNPTDETDPTHSDYDIVRSRHESSSKAIRPYCIEIETDGNGVQRTGIDFDVNEGDACEAPCAESWDQRTCPLQFRYESAACGEEQRGAGQSFRLDVNPSARWNPWVLEQVRRRSATVFPPLSDVTRAPVTQSTQWQFGNPFTSTGDMRLIGGTRDAVCGSSPVYVSPLNPLGIPCVQTGGASESGMPRRVSLSIPRGMRLVAIRVDGRDALYDALAVHDRIDVLHVQSADNPAQCVASNIEVLSIQKDESRGPTVLALATPADALRLSQADLQGRLQLSLRNPHESSDTLVSITREKQPGAKQRGEKKSGQCPNCDECPADCCDAGACDADAVESGCTKCRAAARSKKSEGACGGCSSKNGCCCENCPICNGCECNGNETAKADATNNADLDNVLLNFTASFCTPCQQMKPIVAAMRKQGSSIRLIDVQTEPELANRFKVTQIPCFIALAGGQEVDRKIGACTREELNQLLAKIPRSPVATNRSERSERQDSISSGRSTDPRTADERINSDLRYFTLGANGDFMEVGKDWVDCCDECDAHEMLPLLKKLPRLTRMFKEIHPDLPEHLRRIQEGRSSGMQSSQFPRGTIVLHGQATVCKGEACENEECANENCDGECDDGKCAASCQSARKEGRDGNNCEMCPARPSSSRGTSDQDRAENTREEHTSPDFGLAPPTRGMRTRRQVPLHFSVSTPSPTREAAEHLSIAADKLDSVGQSRDAARIRVEATQLQINDLDRERHRLMEVQSRQREHAGDRRPDRDAPATRRHESPRSAPDSSDDRTSEPAKEASRESPRGPSGTHGSRPTHPDAASRVPDPNYGARGASYSVTTVDPATGSAVQTIHFSECTPGNGTAGCTVLGNVQVRSVEVGRVIGGLMGCSTEFCHQFCASAQLQDPKRRLELVETAANCLRELRVDESELRALETQRTVITAEVVQHGVALTNSDIIAMVKRNVPEAVITRMVQTCQPKFTTDPRHLQSLRQAGVSDSLIHTLLNASRVASRRESPR